MNKSTPKTYRKQCKKCSGHQIKRDGCMQGKQGYKCKDCEYVFQNKTHTNLGNIEARNKQLWEDYSMHKQTYSELTQTYKISIRAVQKKLDEYIVPIPLLVPKAIILLIDTTYFGDIGIMVFKDASNKKIIHSILVTNESLYDYKSGVRKLQEQGWIIQGIVCDGKKGLPGGFGDIPTQMCQFHQVAIIRRYVTKKPQIQPNKDLKTFGELLTRTDRETFEYTLKQYEEHYSSFLKEKTEYIDPRTGKQKWHYTHKKTRLAFLLLKRNLPYLFVSYNHFHTLDIPNTTNGLEGYFSHLKSKVRIHRGLKKERKMTNGNTLVIQVDSFPPIQLKTIIPATHYFSGGH